MNHQQPKPAPITHDVDQRDQHFLSQTAAKQFVKSAVVEPSDAVLDIGAGTGSLTAAILERSPGKVIAVEPDPQCILHLLALRCEFPTLIVEHGRIQDTDLPRLADITAVVANPPFSVLDDVTVLLRQLPRLQRASLCVGRRWAETATAQLHDNRYGRASVAVQSRFDARMLALIDGADFTPSIRQPAALLQLTRLARPHTELDQFAEVLLHRGGERLKDFIRSRRLPLAIGPTRHHRLLQGEARRLQQKRLNNLDASDIRMIATALTWQP